MNSKLKKELIVNIILYMIAYNKFGNMQLVDDIPHERHRTGRCATHAALERSQVERSLRENRVVQHVDIRCWRPVHYVAAANIQIHTVYVVKAAGNNKETLINLLSYALVLTIAGVITIL